MENHKIDFLFQNKYLSQKYTFINLKTTYLYLILPSENKTFVLDWRENPFVPVPRLQETQKIGRNSRK